MRHPTTAAARALKQFSQTFWFGLLWMAALLALATAAVHAG